MLNDIARMFKAICFFEPYIRLNMCMVPGTENSCSRRKLREACVCTILLRKTEGVKDMNGTAPFACRRAVLTNVIQVSM